MRASPDSMLVTVVGNGAGILKISESAGAITGVESDGFVIGGSGLLATESVTFGVEVAHGSQFHLAYQVMNHV